MEVSPRPGSRQAKKAATRDALVAGARACFAEIGYANTQIGDITRKAGVAHGTFYVHFANKETLLEELLAAFNEGLVDRLRAVEAGSRMRGVTGLEPLVRRMAHTFVGYWLEHRDFVQAVAQKTALGTSTESLRDGINPQMVTYLTRALQETAGALGTALPQVELVTHGLLAMWMRIGMKALFDDAVSQTDAEECLVAMTVGVLRQTVTRTIGAT
jgi:AcrR family transcriptional regulator